QMARLEAVYLADGIEVVLKDPIVGRIVADPVLIFNNAAYGDIRQRESFGVQFYAAPFEDRLVEGLAGELHDGPVTVDGSRPQVVYSGVDGAYDFPVSVALAAFRQNLDTVIDKLIPHGVVYIVCIVKLDSRRSRIIGYLLQLQLGGRNREPVFFLCACRQRQDCRSDHYYQALHAYYPSVEIGSMPRLGGAAGRLYTNMAGVARVLQERRPSYRSEWRPAGGGTPDPAQSRLRPEHQYFRCRVSRLVS